MTVPKIPHLTGNPKAQGSQRGRGRGGAMFSFFLRTGNLLSVIQVLVGDALCHACYSNDAYDPEKKVHMTHTHVCSSIFAHLENHAFAQAVWTHVAQAPSACDGIVAQVC